MAQRKDKDSGLPQTARSSGPTTNRKTERGENQKDPHEYDPWCATVILDPWIGHINDRIQTILVPCWSA